MRSFTVVRYEDMSRRPGPTFRGVAAFLGLKPPARAHRAGGAAFLLPHACGAQEDRTGFVERTPAQDRFFRSGRVGGWREALSEAQVRRVVERHHAQMARFGYVPAGHEGADAAPERAAAG